VNNNLGTGNGKVIPSGVFVRPQGGEVTYLIPRFWPGIRDDLPQDPEAACEELAYRMAEKAACHLQAVEEYIAARRAARAAANQPLLQSARQELWALRQVRTKLVGQGVVLESWMPVGDEESPDVGAMLLKDLHQRDLEKAIVDLDCRIEEVESRVAVLEENPLTRNEEALLRNIARVAAGEHSRAVTGWQSNGTDGGLEAPEPGDTSRPGLLARLARWWRRR
jgi:hypothetical protein